MHDILPEKSHGPRAEWALAEDGFTYLAVSSPASQPLRRVDSHFLCQIKTKRLGLEK